MSEINNGGTAFPTVAGHPVYSNGVTLRDWFAGQALEWVGHNEWFSSDPKHVAERAYRMADAMIAARGDRT